MSAHVTKGEFSPVMPTRISHYFKDEPEYLVVPEAPSPSLFRKPGLLGKLILSLRWLVALPRRRAVLDELGALTDHELSDIGLSRTDLSRVFDPSFAAERHAERSVIASRMPTSI